MANENLDNLGFSDEATYLRSLNTSGNNNNDNKEGKGFIAGTGVKSSGNKWW